MLGAVVLAAAVATPPRTLDDCDALLRDHPGEIKSYLCYWLTGRSLRALDDAARRLDARLALSPDDHLAELYLGLVEADLRHPRAGALFERAAAGLAAGDNRTAEVYAWISLARWRQNQGQHRETADALARGRAAAVASGDPLLLARTDWEDSREAFLLADYGRAWALASKADAAITEEAPADLRIGILGSLGASAWSLGRYRDAYVQFEREAELQHGMRNFWAESRARTNMAILGGALLGEGDMSVDEVRALTRNAFDVAVAAADPWVEGDVRLLLAQDPAIPLTARREHAEWVLRAGGKPERTAEALRRLAALSLEGEPAHPEEALAFVERAEAAARESGSPLEVAQSAVARMNARWTIGPRDRAVADTLAALDAVERIRDLQRDDLVRARWFSEQAIHYYRAAGRVLESEAGSPSPETLALAFSIAERMRARALLDALDAQRTTAPAEAGKSPRDAERAGVLSEIAAEQRQLAQGGLAPEEKARHLRALEERERRERILRDEIAGEDPRFATLKRPALASLSEVQALLRDDEALLAYQISTRRIADVAGSSGGGSWVFVVTRAGARALPLPDAAELRAAIDVYLGTFARRDGLDRVASPRLYDAILSEPLRGLPPAVRRLVVVPDRDLHRLPFHALAAASNEAPLAARFEISIVPSATIWARSRREGAGPAGPVTLAFADPDLPGDSEASTLRQAAPWIDGLRLGPLPHARTEAGRLQRLLGDRCRALEGSAATEGSLKRARLGDCGLLVLATHAVVDEERPDRSAVLLSPGTDGEDGLLQPREIGALPLGGKLVVLSSCSSATGTLLRGEGVLGIARSFFLGGARSVVASLWPMRDDEAAAIADRFYEHLGRGVSAGTALARARRDRIAQGAPAAEWAGLVLLGDADLVPFPGGVPPRGSPWGPVAITAAAILLLWGLARFVRGDFRARVRPSP